MSLETIKLNVNVLEWLKLQLRIAALEHDAERLRYRFDFSGNLLRELTCHVYFRDDDANSIKAESDSGRQEIYEGWISIANDIIRNAVELACLPAGFQWRPTVKYVLYESYGMGGSILHKTERIFG